MRSIILSVIYSALRTYAGSGLFDRVVEKVRFLTTVQGMTGAEKMKMVLEFAQAELLGLGETLVRAIVEVYLLKNAEG